MLSQYWTQFADLSWYEVRFARDEGMTPLLTTTLLTTTNPEQIVSAYVPYKGGGHLVLLPALSLRDPDRPNERGIKNPETSVFRLNCIHFVQQLLGVDSELRGKSSSPPPDWASDSRYETPAQHQLRDQLRDAQEAEEEARRSREELEASLDDASLLRSLLFAQGRQLEDAILRALKTMGVEADRFEEDGSEFDAVFSIDGQRILGEAERRDRAAISIDKITQLERNVAEDFAREKVSEHAHGVLFGNPERLVAPDERTKTFTDKCISSAERNEFALVLTHTMFEPAAYLEANSDEGYASACRAAIVAAEGQLVEFPDVPDKSDDASR